MATRNTTIIALVLALGVAGCTSKAQQSTQSIDESQRSAVVSRDTDSDYLEENGDPEVETCEAITAKGHRCTRRVLEAGLLCKQHSKMVKAGKKVKTVE